MNFKEVISMTCSIRLSTKEDSSLILSFIKELAQYEKMADRVTATVHSVEKTFFCKNPRVEALILEENGQPVGFAVFFQNFSTFLCQYGIYIEDIYIKEAFRGKGYGKALFQRICFEAVKRECGRVEWWCLDWNKPSIDFYLKLGAEPMYDWTVFRLDQERIKAISAQ
jgi:GNAT superfamily N-acetyltransferase